MAPPLSPDIVDRGRDTIALYRLMDALRTQAQRAGGGVVSLLGNHGAFFGRGALVPTDVD